MAKKYWIALGVFALIIIVSFFGLQAFAKNKLREVLTITTAEGDSLRFQDISLSLLSGNLRLDSVRVHWVIDNDPDNEGLLYELDGKLSSLQLNGIDLFSYIFNGEYQAKKLKLSGPELIVSGLSRSVTKDSTSQNSNASTMPTETMQVKIGAIEVGPTRMVYRKPDQEQDILQIDSFTFIGKDLKLPAPEDAAPYPEAMQWSARNLTYIKPDGVYDIKVGHLEGNSLDSHFIVRQFRMEPRYELQALRRLYPKENSQLTVDIGQANLQGFAWLKVLQDQYLDARSVELSDFYLNAFEIGSVAPEAGVYKPLYQQQLLQAPIPIQIDSVRIIKSHIRYELLPATGQQSGHIDFSNFYASIYNITNDSSVIAKSPHLYADIESDFHNASNLKVHFDMLLNSPVYAYTYSGNMYNFPLPQLNPFLRHTSDMEIEEGVIDELSFNISANNQKATGDLIFVYDGLKINWLEGHNIFKAVGQKIFVREKNPRGEKFRKGRVYFERIPNRSFWHLFYNSLLSGLQSTALPNLFLPDELDVDKKNRKVKRQK